jgi:hypothetical protein
MQIRPIAAFGSENDLSGNRHQKTLRGAAIPDIAREKEKDPLLFAFSEKIG